MNEVIRRRELEELAQGLESGRWWAVYAAAGSGKTVFLAQLERFLRSTYRVIYINLRACAGLDLAGLYSYVAGVMAPGVQVGTALELRRFLAGSGGRRVLLLDDAGALASDVAGPFFNMVAALHSESRFFPALQNLRMVLASSRDLRQLSSGANSCLNTLDELFLSDFTRDEAAFLAGDEDWETIWALASGHPWLTSYLARQELPLGLDPARAGDRMARREIPLLRSLRLQLSPELLMGYQAGVWTDYRQARRLKLLGLARESEGRLLVRNSIFRRVVEDWLSQADRTPGRGDTAVFGQMVAEDPALWPGRQEHGGQRPGSGLRVCRIAKQVRLDGNPIHLTTVEFRILEHLLLHWPGVVSRDSLAGAAYPGEPVPGTDVESHIKNIRRKLGDKASEPRFIRSRRGFGYQAVEKSFQFE